MSNKLPSFNIIETNTHPSEYKKLNKPFYKCVYMQSLLSWTILCWIFKTLTTNHNISRNPYTFTKLLWQCECICQNSV